jgi:carbon storage regulator
MLVLSRKSEQTIQIGPDIEVTVLSVANGRVKLGIRAPEHVRVLRGELKDDSTSATCSPPRDRPSAHLQQPNWDAPSNRTLGQAVIAPSACD